MTTSTAKDHAWRMADREVEKAQKKMAKKMTAALPVGRRVAWRHGNHVRSGVVSRPVNPSWWAIGHTKIAVISDQSGREVRAPAYGILDYFVPEKN